MSRGKKEGSATKKRPARHGRVASDSCVVLPLSFLSRPFERGIDDRPSDLVEQKAGKVMESHQSLEVRPKEGNDGVGGAKDIKEKAYPFVLSRRTERYAPSGDEKTQEPE